MTRVKEHQNDRFRLLEIVRQRFRLSENVRKCVCERERVRERERNKMRKRDCEIRVCSNRSHVFVFNSTFL